MMMGMGKKEAGTEDFMLDILVVYHLNGTTKRRFPDYVIAATSFCCVNTANTAPEADCPGSSETKHELPIT